MIWLGVVSAMALALALWAARWALGKLVGAWADVIRSLP